eukprot:CAMPEP_0179444256 /NCGR_PEP_ID=MMETSP0799-20121207/27730_1 /TAXON_ID=46947 /ORGANISM="Geminigera cryophila, Strain CCMP2564" /LENGTH=204 /DNA_ID=CAMNT_0021231173 /DNA_START=124 /DNA_END=738 /DNA_ORIENTATION=+
MSWDVRNLDQCSIQPHIQAGWESACLRQKSNSVYCSSFLISEGCPDTPTVQGILPCQYDNTKVDEDADFFPIGNTHNGDSHCANQADFQVCARKYNGCFKTVKETYEKGSVKQWTVTKGCGTCSFINPNNWQIFSTCDQTACLSPDGVCDGECFQSSDRSVTIEYCHECQGEMCNLGARRATHHALALTLMGIFFTLLVRKCRA